jgi:hypothetical protein
MKTMNTLSCFSDLIRQIQELPNYVDKRKQLAEVLGVADTTIRHWMAGSVPQGMSMVSLRYYLDYLGYKVEELAKTSKVMQGAGKLLAFRVTTLEEMAQFTTGHGHYGDQVLAAIRGSRGLSDEREGLFQKFVEAHSSELATVLTELPRLIVLDVKTEALEVKIMEETGQTHSGQSAILLKQKDGQGAVVDSNSDEHFKCLTHMLLDYANRYVHPEVGDNERDRLRQVVGQRKIFDLKNVLVRLCGNTAFKQS